MKTIYTTLPIYDSVLKQDYNRSGCIIPIYTPRHRLPSWQYQTTETPGAVTAITLINAAGTLMDLTPYFGTLSDAYVLGASTYYKYDGDTLYYLLPYGAYYIKITHANGYYYYSEWFVVTDVYPKLFTDWTKGDYETFTTSGTIVESAINSAANGLATSTQSFNLRMGESVTIIFFLTLNSGDLPLVVLGPSGLATNVAVAATVGLNEITLTSTWDGASVVAFFNNTNTNFWATEVYAIRSYSSTFIRIDFHDTHDLGDIVYQSSFTQSLWLNTQLNTPQHEPVMVGEEKDGIFIAEKIVTKFKFRIVTYVGPVFYRALIRLPQHDTITITDEVGFTYSPAAGNLQVSPISWNAFDYGTLEIVFNDDSEFIWTSEANNLT